eukprot:230955-Chlamydomonas_euryale.AAC.6
MAFAPPASAAFDPSNSSKPDSPALEAFAPPASIDFAPPAPSAGLLAGASRRNGCCDARTPLGATRPAPPPAQPGNGPRLAELALRADAKSRAPAPPTRGTRGARACLSPPLSLLPAAAAAWGAGLRDAAYPRGGRRRARTHEGGTLHTKSAECRSLGVVEDGQGGMNAVAHEVVGEDLIASPLGGQADALTPPQVLMIQQTLARLPCGPHSCYLWQMQAMHHAVLSAIQALALQAPFGRCSARFRPTLPRGTLPVTPTSV